MTDKIKIFQYGAHCARDYWNLIVQPDLDDFRRLVSPRSAIHVAQSLWNLWEWMEADAGRIKKASEPDFPELYLIKGIALSAKHCAISDKEHFPDHAGPLPTGAIAYDVAGGYGVSSGGYGSADPVIILKDGTSRAFAEIVERVAENLSRRL